MTRMVHPTSEKNQEQRAKLEALIQSLTNDELVARRRLVHDRAFTMPDGQAKRTHQLMHLMLQHEIKVRQMLAEMVDKA